MSTKYTTLFEYKLPSYIRDDPSYERFIQFFDAYYQWFDDTYDIYGFGDKLDIDSGFSDFYSYFAADFLPYFPDVNTIAADKVKLIKIIKELYKSKGIPESFKFLFRALYNVHAEVYETNQYILKPSDGKWIVPKSIKIKSLDVNFLNIDNFKVLGNVSQSVGIIEKSKISGKFIQIYLSNIERVFKSGEPITILDYYNNPVYFLNGKYFPYTNVDDIPSAAVKLTSKIIGALSSINIVPARRGKYYRVGDPVVLKGGFDVFTTSPIGANAYISEVTTGQILNILVTKGGYGYTTFPNTSIDVIKDDGTVDLVANCIVSIVDKSSPALVSYLCNDCIEDNMNISIGNTSLNFYSSPNANTPLKNFISYTTFQTYPITGITVRNGGGGYELEPSLNLNTMFLANTINQYSQHLEDMGILAPIQIVNGGENYTVNDTINITGGSGNFAYARINSVNTSGAILSVEYYKNSQNEYNVGGLGYSNDNLPTITIQSSYGANASLIVPGILATGVEYSLQTDKIGAITKIALSENGEDYVYTPNVSLRLQDIAVSGTNAEVIDPSIMIVYQGDFSSPIFIGYIDSTYPLYFDQLLGNQVFAIRIYDYKGTIDSSKEIIIRNTATNSDASILNIQTNYFGNRFKSGVKSYGDGSALATVNFLEGLIKDEGRYLNSDGQLSAHSVLQNDMYNSFTYVLSTEKDYESYKTVVTNLLHPVGKHLVTRNLLKANSSFVMNANTDMKTGNTQINVNSSIVITNSNSIFSNTIYINCANIQSQFSSNDRIYIIGDTSLNVYSKIISVKSNNIVELEDYVQYKFPAIYNGYANSNTIIITHNNYKETKYSLDSFAFIGDSILIANNSINHIINIVDNTLYFANTLNISGTATNTANVTLTKTLTSNNITIYKSV